MSEIFEKFRLSGKLPSPSGVGMRILKLTQSDDYSTEEIGQAIMADSALTGRLLKLANSAQSGSMRHITTVAEATIRLGISTVRNVALGLSLISENRNGACEGFDYDRYWAKSLARAATAQALSRNTGAGVPAEMYILGLLGDIGGLALASVHPEDYTRMLDDYSGHSPREFAEMEKRVFEIDHHEVGACMLAEWGLPETFQRAVSGYEYLSEGGRFQSVATVVDVLYAADVIAELILCNESTPAAIRRRLRERLEQVATCSGMNAELFYAMCNSAASEWREWGNVLKIPTHKPVDFTKLDEQASGASASPVEEGADQGVHAKRPRRASAATAADDADGAALRILAVDDDAMSLKLLERHLLRAGYRVTTAADGNSALQIVLEEQPQLVIADWAMPGMDGLELCKALRRIESGRRIYFLLLTGHDEEDSVVHAFEAGVDDYVVKPFNPRILMARIRGGKRIIDLQEQGAKDQETQRKLVAELQLMTRKLRSAALTDVLTGLPNRRYAMKRLAQAWEAAARTEAPLSIIGIDIDHFKSVNDDYGHDAGDEVLRATAHAMRGVMREDEDLCRVGGEEFLVICSNTTADQAAAAAERLRQSVESNVIEWGKFHRALTISLGVAQRALSTTSLDSLLKAADEAVYESKSAGRNRVTLASMEQAQKKSA